MTSSDSTVLCRYRYDPLDRLASSSPFGQLDIQRFYQKNRLATEIQGTVQRTVFQHEDLLLAQQRRTEAQLDTTLWATDQQRSVLQLVDKTGTEPMAYSVYGHHPAESGLTSLLGFNGERRDPVTGHYLLGNGYRAYNPVLMRFNSPDSLSPFGEGGVNAYGYCGGDPVGFVDPSGHVGFVAHLKRTINGMSNAVDASLDAIQASANSSRPSVIAYGSTGVRNTAATNVPVIAESSKQLKNSLGDGFAGGGAQPVINASGPSKSSSAIKQVVGSDGGKNVGSPKASTRVNKGGKGGVRNQFYKEDKDLNALREKFLKAAWYMRHSGDKVNAELHESNYKAVKAEYLQAKLDYVRARDAGLPRSKTQGVISHYLRRNKL